MQSADSNHRLTECESEIARLRRTIRVATTFGVAAMVAMLAGFAVPPLAKIALSSDTLRVREIAVVDERGVVRARLGGNLPDALNRSGRPIPRGDRVAGLLIYDDHGAERGGYVTFEKSGIAALTLDSRGPQVAIFAADSSPGNGAGLRVWTGKSWAEIKADAGGPHISAGRDGRVAFLEPPTTKDEQGAFCRELKAEVAQIPKQPSSEEVLAACRAHRTEKECNRCLGKP